MRKPNLRLALAPLCIAPVCLALTAAAPEPQKPIDLQQYGGRWFEVARLHNEF